MWKRWHKNKIGKKKRKWNLEDGGIDQKQTNKNKQNTNQTKGDIGQPA